MQFDGLLKDTLDLLSPHGHILANFAHVMAIYGTSLGRYPHLFWRGKVYPNMYWVLVGKTGCGKGRSFDAASKLFDFGHREDYLLAPISHENITSGKGLVEHTDAYLSHFGDEENRLLLTIAEFEATLACTRIATNKVSSNLINLYDGKDICETIGKKCIRLSGLHFGLVGHITPELLHKRKTNTMVASGLANRIFFIQLPDPSYSSGESDFDKSDLMALQGKIITSLDKGGQRELVEMTPDAKERFAEFDKANFDYAPSCSALKDLTARFGSQCLKLALTISLFNGEDQVSLPSMESALSVMEYSKASLENLFGDSSINTLERQVREFVEKNGTATRTQLTQEFCHICEKAELDRVLENLVKNNVISESISTGVRGRRTTTYAPILIDAA